MLSADKMVLSLYEMEVASARINTFKARSRAPQEVHVGGNGENLAK